MIIFIAKIILMHHVSNPPGNLSVISGVCSSSPQAATQKRAKDNNLAISVKIHSTIIFGYIFNSAVASLMGMTFPIPSNR